MELGRRSPTLSGRSETTGRRRRDDPGTPDPVSPLCGGNPRDALSGASVPDDVGGESEITLKEPQIILVDIIALFFRLVP